MGGPCFLPVSPPGTAAYAAGPWTPGGHSRASNGCSRASATPSCPTRSSPNAREAVAEARRRVERRTETERGAGRRSGATDLEAVVADAAARVDRRRVALLAPVVNATGVLLHTNLGRAPLGRGGARRDGRGRRATRTSSTGSTRERAARARITAAHLLALACGAEAGFVVNNNAAAVLLVLATMARGREVLVSRGELVEIGGGFRVPEILAETGAHLVEVGTTNRTRLADYERARLGAHRARVEGARVELPHGRVHRGGTGRPSSRRSDRRWSSTRVPGSSTSAHRGSPSDRRGSATSPVCGSASTPAPRS